VTSASQVRFRPGAVIGHVFARPALLCFAVLLCRDPGRAGVAAFLLAAFASAGTSVLGGHLRALRTALGMRALVNRTWGGWMRPVDVAPLACVRRAADAAGPPDGGDAATADAPVYGFVVHDPEHRPWTGDRAFRRGDGTWLLFFRNPPGASAAGAYARYAVVHAMGRASRWNLFAPGRKLEFRTGALAGAALAFIAGLHPVTLAILVLYGIVLAVAYAGVGRAQAHAQADRLAFQSLDAGDVAVLPRLLRIRARHDRRRHRRYHRGLLAVRLNAARRAARMLRRGETLRDWRIPDHWPTTAAFSLAAGLSSLLLPVPQDIPLRALLAASAVPALAAPLVRRFAAMVERRAVREVVERSTRPALPRPDAAEVKKAPIEVFSGITVGLVLFNLIARPALLCFAVWLIRDPGAATAAGFALAYFVKMNTANFGGNFQSMLTALRLRAFLRQTRGSGLQEVAIESLAHFRRIAHAVHIQWPAWRRSRERRWEDFDMPFKPIRAYVIQDPENRAWTREKTFHTHESTSYLFFRSPPRDQGGSPFARYVLLHELGHAHPLNFYTPGRKLEFTAEPGVGLAFAWAAGFGPLTLGLIAVYWGLMLLHYASEGVRLAHELSADYFAYHALDERDLRLLPRLLKAKARHDCGLARAQRRLALARLRVVRGAVRALDAGEEIPQRFMAPRRPRGVAFAIAAAATVFLAPVPADLPLLLLAGLAFAPLAATLAMAPVIERLDRANVTELAARTIAPAATPQGAPESY
jgi:hypothetical protein